MAPVTISHLFVHRMELTRIDPDNPVPDGKGGFDDGYVSLGILKCRAWPASFADLQLAGQNKAKITHSILFEPLTDVKVEDRLIWEGKTLHIRVTPILPSIQIYVKVLAEEIEE